MASSLILSSVQSYLYNTQTPNRHLWVETAFIPVVVGYLISGLSVNYCFR